MNHFSLAGLKDCETSSFRLLTRSESKVRLYKWKRGRIYIWRVFFPLRDASINTGWSQISFYQMSGRTLSFSAISIKSFSLSFSFQVVYFTEMYNIFSELTDQIDQAGLTDEQRERETEAKLSELRALSIVADD